MKVEEKLLPKLYNLILFNPDKIKLLIIVFYTLKFQYSKFALSIYNLIET